LAKKQVGNIGGREFWEWCGFDYHIEWCAAFVSWAYAQAGKDGPVFLGCYTGAEWFKARGQWGDKYYADIAPGDSVFFDWNFDGDADHVGLVIGTDGEYVYTVEGNRDDICITRGYDRASYAYIIGYGLMEW
ncbi:MAG: CHAP domain-containing protein, partial [Oscillospiraceae bacterium]|nr:CHAP domain-containing protein [Oscillospiraceae bacterium]